MTPPTPHAPDFAQDPFDARLRAALRARPEPRPPANLAARAIALAASPEFASVISPLIAPVSTARGGRQIDPKALQQLARVRRQLLAFTAAAGLLIGVMVLWGLYHLATTRAALDATLTAQLSGTTTFSIESATPLLLGAVMLLGLVLFFTLAGTLAPDPRRTAVLN